MVAHALVLAGGGTGGHVFPLIAVADALRELVPDLRLVFVGTARGIEKRVVPERGYELVLENVLPMVGGGVGGAVRGALRAVSATRKARSWLLDLSPKAVLSIGGYAAGPVSLAARSLGVPLAVIEPNGVMGLANRLLAPLVSRAYLACVELERYFAPHKVRQLGVPLRKGFASHDYFPEVPLQVLVLGGSQGASALNRIVPEALARSSLPLSIKHQAGKNEVEAVQERYRSLQGLVSAEVVPFIDDMPSALAESALVISRSGASAVAEICAVGRPSILLPYPHAAGDHQRKNAEELVRAGAALCIPAPELSVERFRHELERLLRTPTLMTDMARRAQSLGKPDAARDIAEDLWQLAEGTR